jgi:hypothetical protein
VALATTDDLASLLGREFTDAEETQAEAAIRLASAAVSAYLPDVALEPGEDVTVRLRGTWSRDLRLPRRPVLNVSAVTINGDELDGNTGWSWIGGDSIRRGSWYPEQDYAGWDVTQGAAPGPAFHWGGPTAVVEVTYSYGVETVPPAVWMVVVQVAKRLFLNPEGVRQESLGGYAVTYDAGDGVVGLNVAEMAALRQYRTRAR